MVMVGAYLVRMQAEFGVTANAEIVAVQIGNRTAGFTLTTDLLFHRQLSWEMRDWRGRNREDRK